MFYMPQYHNLPDGRQVFLRFPDPELHAQPLIDFLKAAPLPKRAGRLIQFDEAGEARCGADRFGLAWHGRQGEVL